MSKNLVYYNYKEEREDTIMTINELKEQLAIVKEQIFMLDMKDRWDTQDYLIQHKRHARVRELEQQIAEMEG